MNDVSITKMPSWTSMVMTTCSYGIQGPETLFGVDSIMNGSQNISFHYMADEGSDQMKKDHKSQ